MVEPLVLGRKLHKLDGYLKELSSFQGMSFTEYQADFRSRRAVERLIQLIVDVAVDINTHVLVDAGEPPPDDAYSSFTEAGEIGLISLELAKKLAPSTGERNIIVHDYESIDDFIVFTSIKEALTLYREYVKQVFQYIKANG